MIHFGDVLLLFYDHYSTLCRHLVEWLMGLCSLDPGFILCWWPRSHAARHWPWGTSEGWAILHGCTMLQALVKSGEISKLVMKIDEHWNPSEHAQSLAVCESHGLIWCPNYGHLLIRLGLAFPRERWLTFLMWQDIFRQESTFHYLFGVLAWAKFEAVGASSGMATWRWCQA